MIFMYQFAYYQHDWKEPFEADVVNSYMNQMEGKTEITELEPGGDCYEYCIHTKGLDEKTVQFVYEAWIRLDDHEFVLKREENGILTLKDEEEIEELLDLAKE
jgi:hypothetical protein